MADPAQTAAQAAVYSPDGHVYMVPNTDLPDAMKNGGELAVPMRSPKGDSVWVPSSHVGEAQKNGGKVDWSSVPQEQHEGFWGAFGNTLKGMASGVGEMINSNPVEMAVKTGASVATNDILRQSEGRSKGYRVLAAGGETVGVPARAMEESANQGDTAGVLGHAAATAAPIVAAPLVSKLVSAKPPLRGALAEKMAEVPPGEQFSRAEVNAEASTHGVNLDVAQATDSAVAHAAKKANRYSLGSQTTYDAANTKNLAALDEWANSEAAQYSPQGSTKEVLGGKMQQTLRNHLQARENLATQIYNDLDSQVGSSKPDAGSVYDRAKQIVAENADYYDKNPALKQSRAWQIVNDLANRSETTKPGTKTVQSAIVDETGNPVTREVSTPPKAKPDTWSDLQKMRTDLMSEYRSPDIIGTRSEGWLKQLVGELDNTIAESGKSLTGPQLEQFRKANAIWESIKNTYDNPQSPYYHAIRSQFPSQVPGMLSKGTPELARSVRETLGSLQGDFQRQFVENLLNGKDGATLDLKNLNSRLSRVPQDFLESMIGPEGARNLRMLGKVAQKVTADSNPSGTAKVGVPAAEVTGFFHNPIAGAAEIGANYLGAKAINSPKVLDYLTTPSPSELGRMTPAQARKAIAVAMAAKKKNSSE